MDQGTDAIGNKEGGGILEGKDEGRHGGSAEVFSGEGDLDVCVRVEELDESVEAVKAVSDAVGDEFGNLVVGFLQGVVDVLEGNSDGPDDGKDERSEGKGASVVSNGPPETSGQGEVTSGVVGRREIPCANGDDDDVVEQGLDELKDPEEHEHLQVCHFLGVWIQSDFLELRAGLWLLDFSRAHQVAETSDPENDPDNQEEGLEEWHQKDSQVSNDDDGRSLQDTDANGDIFEQADQGNEVENHDAIDGVNSGLDVLALLFKLSLGLRRSLGGSVGFGVEVSVVVDLKPESEKQETGTGGNY